MSNAKLFSPSTVASTAPLLLVLLVAAGLRWAALPEMSDMLNYDESFYAVDALSLLESPRLTPFFEGNTGRQSAWMYWLAAFFLGLGPTPFAARVAATFVSVLTVAATYRLGRALFGRASGVGAAAAMATLYWPVHLGHIAFRANLFPLLGALSLAFLVAAARRNRTALWIASGAALGLMSYTYTSAYLWSALIGAGVVWVGVVRPRCRQGAMLALALALAISAPMALYALQHPAALLQRSGEVSRTDAAALLSAARAWLGAWLVHGDIFHNHNLPGRPIFDLPSAVLAGAGVARLALSSTHRRGALLVLALVSLSILPSALSETPPHFLRSIGLTIPIALVMGAGAALIAQRAHGVLRAVPRMSEGMGRALSIALPVALFAAIAGRTYWDFHHVWLRLPELETLFERRTHRVVAAVQTLDPSDTAIYVAPREWSHPTLLFSQRRLPAAHIVGFDDDGCLVLPVARTGFYVNPVASPENLARALEPWGRVETVHLNRMALVRFTVDGRALQRAGETPLVFGNRVELRADASHLPARAAPGATLSWLARFRLLQPTPRLYALFVHLYATRPDGSADDARTFAQGDQWLCASYPTALWQTDEVIVQQFRLALPGDLPAGGYAIAVGVYDRDSGERLRLPNGETFVVWHSLTVIW